MEADEVVRAAEEAKGHAEQQVVVLESRWSRAGEERKAWERELEEAKAELVRVREEREAEREAWEKKLEEAVELAGKVIDEERGAALSSRRNAEEARGEAEAYRAEKEAAEEEARRARDVARREVDVRIPWNTNHPAISEGRMYAWPRCIGAFFQVSG